MSLLTQWIRVFYSDNGVVSDLSLALDDDSSVSLPFVAAEDALYIAQTMPFNNFHLELDTANTAASDISIELWDGTNWEPAVDILDASASGGASLGQSATIQFSPDRDENWQRVEDTREEPNGFDLASDIVLYDAYYARVKWSADLDVGTTLKRISYVFATDAQMLAIDPEINSYLTSWAASKTDWLEQIRLASLHTIFDLKSKGLVRHPGQILRFEDVSLATAYKTLAIIYNKLGPGFEFQRDNANAQYMAIFSNARMTFDSNRDGQVDPSEENNSIGRGLR